MLVVLTVIGLLAGISFPSLSAGLDSVRLTSATQSVASFINAAVDRSERHQEAVELVLTPGHNSLSAYSNDSAAPRELQLPEGIVIEATLPPLPDEADLTRRILIVPGGATPGIGIQLVNKHGSRRLVKLDPFTGFPRVESVISK